MKPGPVARSAHACLAAGVAHAVHAVAGRARGMALAWLLLLISAPSQALCLAPLCSCSVSVGSLVFPAYNPLANRSSDSTADAVVRCTGAVGLSIPYDLGMGAGSAGAFSLRRMWSGAVGLGYNLFADAGLTTVWGDGSSGSNVLSSSVSIVLLGQAAQRTHTVHARIPAGQTSMVPGSYSDAVLVTLTYY